MRVGGDRASSRWSPAVVRSGPCSFGRRRPTDGTGGDDHVVLDMQDAKPALPRSPSDEIACVSLILWPRTWSSADRLFVDVARAAENGASDEKPIESRVGGDHSVIAGGRSRHRSGCWRFGWRGACSERCDDWEQRSKRGERVGARRRRSRALSRSRRCHDARRQQQASVGSVRGWTVG